MFTLSLYFAFVFVYCIFLFVCIFFFSIDAISLVNKDVYIKYLSSETHEKRRASRLDIFEQLTVQRGPIRKQHDFFVLMTISIATVTHFHKHSVIFGVPRQTERLKVCHQHIR